MTSTPFRRPIFDLSGVGGGGVTATIRRLENRWQQAIREHDLDALDQLVADDFVGTSSSGRAGSKATLLREMRRDKNVYSSAEAREMAVRAEGDNMAVVTGTATETGTTSRGKPFRSSRRFTDTWAKQDGRWRCVASHITQLPQR